MRFSILTASHNNERHIGEAIQSVVNQTYKDWEMIIVDDCSTDSTYEKSLSLASNHSNIRVYRNDERQYCANTYQRLVEMANGEICGVLDGDDALVKTAIERIVGLYDKYRQIGFVYSQSWWCNDDLKPRRKGLSRLPLKGELLFMGQRLKHCYSHWRTFKTELRERRKPLFERDLKCAVDKSLGYVLEELAPGGFLDECLYFYRYHKDNMSHKTAQRPVWKKVAERALRRRQKNNIKSKGIKQIK